MAQFESAYSEFTKRNAAAVFIAAQKIDGLFKGKRHIEDHTYPFPVLFDESRAVTQSYGVYQLAGIDALQWIAVSPHQFEAPAIDEVLRAIESGGKY
jgi:peroxiredoxin